MGFREIGVQKGGDREKNKRIKPQVVNARFWLSMFDPPSSAEQWVDSCIAAQGDLIQVFSSTPGPKHQMVVKP